MKNPCFLFGAFIAIASLHAQPLTWTQRNTGISAGLQYSSAAFGNGRYVVLAYGNGATAGTFQTQSAVSTDTLTWTTSVLPTNPVSRGITFGGGLFVTVAERNGADSGNTQNVLTSPDGSAWTPRTTGAGTLNGVAFAGGRYIAVGDQNGGQNAVTSTDGTTWTRVPVGQSSTGFLGIVSHPTLNNFVAWSANPTNEVWVTANGTTWTRVVINGAEFIHSVAYAGGTYIAISFGSTGVIRLFSSPDGTTWTTGPTVGAAAFYSIGGFGASNSIASGAGRVVVAGGSVDANFNSVPSVVESTGALSNWTTTPLGTSAGFTQNKFAFFANNLWFVGNNNTQLFVSTDSSGPVTPPPSPPVIAVQPAAQVGTVGGSITFTVTATGTGLSFQWLFNNNAISGATNATYTLTGLTAANAGNYSVRITNAGGTITSNPAALTVNPVSTSIAFLSNLSVRARAGSGSETLIVGVTVGGSATSSAKSVLIRGIGPALATFGVTGVLPDPVLTILNGTTVIATNDDWGTEPGIAATSLSVGAFALPVGSRDSAIFGTGIGNGGYTVQLTGKAGATGNALIELYDTATAASITATTTRFTNLSARTFGGTGNDTLIVGFNLAGSGTRRLLIRAVGPGLAAFGVTGTMPDPKLELYSDSTKTGENDNWDASTLTAQQSVGAFALTSGSRDAVLVTTLNPGGYTVQVTGGTTGVVLVEVYEAP